MQSIAWGFCGKRNIQMSFIKSILYKFSKPLKSEDFIVHEDDEISPVELKSNSGKIVKVYFLDVEKEILVSEDVAKILIERKKAELCQ
jgi:hypothetical protein